MKKSRFFRGLLAVIMILQSLLGVPLPAFAELPAPQLHATVVNEKRVDLNWNGVSGATGYEILRGGASVATVTEATYSYTDIAVEPNGEYTYTIRAYNETESQTGSSVTVFTDKTPPTDPANLRLTPTATSVYLQWDASNDIGKGVDRYNVYAGIGQQLVASPTTNYYNHTNRTPGTNYEYYVTAVDQLGNESPIAQAAQGTVTTLPDTAAPQAPTGLAASVASETQINLSWNAATDNVGVVGYIVYRSAANTKDSFSDYTTTSRNYSFTGLQAGATYYFKVRAKDAAGNLSDYSAIATGATSSDTQKPTAPSIWGLATSTTQIKLTWSGATDNKGVAGYEIYRATGSGSFSRLAADNTSPYYDSSLSSNTTYRYYIKTKDAAGNISDASNTVSVQTNNDTQAPSKPANLKLTLVSNTEVKLAWDAATDNKAVSGYNIYRALDTGSFSWITSTSSTSCNNSGLTSNKNYKYYVKAYDAAGNESDASDTQTIYTSTSGQTEEKTITASQGGTLEITDLVKLDIPKDALNKNVTYKMVTKTFNGYSTTGFKTFGQPVELTAKDGSTSITSFDRDLTLTFYYTSSALGTTDTNKMSIYYWDDDKDKWIKVTSTVSTSSKKVTATVDHFTVFALLADVSGPSVPSLDNSSTSANRVIKLNGKADANNKVYISLNGNESTVTASSSGTFSLEVLLSQGSNEVKLKAENSSGTQSAWSGTYTIYCTPAFVLNDIAGHWAEMNIQKVAELDITRGYQDGTFKPNKTITRAEFAKFVVSALGLSPVSDPELNFKDNNSIPTWAKGYIARAIKEDIISGYADNTFKANKQITRQEMASMLVRALGLQEMAASRQNSSLNFDDAGGIESWARGAVSLAVEKGLLKGYSDNTFGPRKNATRAEAATMIVKLLSLK